MKYRWYIRKRKVEDVVIFPFVLLGKIIARFKPLEKEYETFFFFLYFRQWNAIDDILYLIVKGEWNLNLFVLS